MRTFKHQLFGNQRKSIISIMQKQKIAIFKAKLRIL